MKLSGVIVSAAILGLAATPHVIPSPGLGSGASRPGAAAGPVTRNTPSQSGKAQVLATYGRLPLSFEANHGQADAQVKFLSRGPGHTLFLTPTEAMLILRTAQAQGKAELMRQERPRIVSPAVLRLRLLGANPAPEVAGLDKLPGKVNYFIGSDPHKWRTRIPTYARVQYQDVYPGVNLIYYGTHGQLEWDFIVAPGADPKAIALGVEGVDALEVDAQGDLVLHTPGGAIRLRKPFVYQEEDGIKQAISGGYVLRGKDRVGFHVAAYDASRPLVIDPVLSYSTYLGTTGDDEGHAIAVDAAGNAYVTGTSNSDVLVLKVDTTGSALVYATLFGGWFWDGAEAIAVDAFGNAYVTGMTWSPDFPTTPGAFDRTCGTDGTCNFDGVLGRPDAFVAKLSPDGSALLYSTYLGGSDEERSFGIAVDAAGNAYVTGDTQSPDFPMANPFQPDFKGGPSGWRADAFVTKLNPTGSALVYSTYLGGSGGESGQGIAVDAAGNAYVTGSTESLNFPTVNPFQATYGGGDFLEGDGFAAKLNPAGTALVYSTYLGGSRNDWGESIAVDAAGNAYVTGWTGSPNFPTANPIQPLFGGGLCGSITVFPCPDAFVLKVNSIGQLVYSTYLGGSRNDWGRGIAVDAAGSAYVTGQTGSPDFPTANPMQPTPGGLSDAFIAKIVDTATGPPDLVETAVSNPPAGAVLGASFSVTDTARNQGTGAAGASTTRYYLSLNQTKGSGDKLLTGTRAVPGLAAGTESGGTVTVKIPAGLASGVYYLLACADDKKVVAESNEANNCRASAATVQVTGPDLVETALGNPPGSVVIGGSFQVTDTARNQGDAGAGASTTRYYLSLNQTKGSGDKLLTGTRAVPALAVGAQSAGAAMVTVPTTAVPGVYYLLACADDKKKVFESNEKNNCRASATQVTVNP